jgi:hypothetical protein
MSAKDAATAAGGTPQTSIGDAAPPPDEVTVRFRRWHAFGPTAFQRGQEAGFSPRDAEMLARRNIAIVVHDRSRLTAGAAMVTK